VQAGTTLFVTGNINGSAAATLTKRGDGELRYSLATGKSVTFGGRTQVADGLLTLNTPERNVIVGPLDIGGAGTVRLLGEVIGGINIQLPGTGNAQIADNVVVSFQPGGVLDLNDNNDTVGGLDMTGGEVRTGNGVPPLIGGGVLGLNGNVTVHASNAVARLLGK